MEVVSSRPALFEIAFIVFGDTFAIAQYRDMTLPSQALLERGLPSAFYPLFKYY
jgi:hypothetical protein